MRFLISALLLFVLPISVAAKASDKDYATVISYQYIGDTTYTDDGSFDWNGEIYGVGAMNKACAEEYGDGARASTLAEVFNRPRPDLAWYAPGASPIHVVADPFGFLATDSATGATVGTVQPSESEAAAAAYCGRFLDNSFGSGPCTFIGIAAQCHCGNILPVACSAPVAITVQ